MLLREFSGQTRTSCPSGNDRRPAFVTRVDPISGHVAKIVSNRTVGPFGLPVDPVAKDGKTCAFCVEAQDGIKDRISHDCGAVSLASPRSCEKYDWVTVYPPFGQHRPISEAYFGGMDDLVQSSYDLAKICSRDPEVVAFTDFTNWGVAASPTHQHPHSHRKSATGAVPPRITEEMRNCREIMREYGKNPFDLLEKEEAQDGRRVIHNDGVFIGAPFAPTCSDEIVIFPKEQITNIIETGSDFRRRLVYPVLSVFPALFFYCNVVSLTIAVHMAPFADIREARRYYRWHVHVYPRRSEGTLDGEMRGFGTSVIETPPEATAELLKRWYRDGPREEFIKDERLRRADPALFAQLRRETVKSR